MAKIRKGSPHIDAETDRLARIGGLFMSDPASKRKHGFPKIKKRRRVMKPMGRDRA
jgi:hypothetical protein